MPSRRRRAAIPAPQVEPAAPAAAGLTHPRVERWIDLLIIGVTVAAIPLTIAEETGAHQGGRIAIGFDWLIWAVIFAEVVVMGVLAPDRGAYWRRHIRSFLAIVLAFPGIVLLVQQIPGVNTLEPAQIFHVGRFFALLLIVLPAFAFFFGRTGLAYVMAVTLMVVLIGGAAISIVEPDTVKGGFWSGIWFALVTIATVGYGDIAPVTPVGRMIASAMIIVGLGLVATLSASLAAHMVGQDQGDDIHDMADRFDVLDRITEKMERIETKLEALLQRDAGLGDAEVAADERPAAGGTAPHAKR